MKKILLSQRLIQNTGYPELREALDVQWGAFFSHCKLLPIPVSLHVPIEHYFKELKPDGVLLTGGNDLSCCNPQDPLSQKRDELETQIIKQAIHNHLPVIGVCRGMQMLAHHFGSLIEKREGHVVSHVNEFVPGGIFSEFYSKTGEFNSYHGFCVTQLGNVLKPEGHALKDKTVEAFRHESLPIFGLMWHPERVTPFAERDVDFFRYIYHSALNSSK